MSKAPIQLELDLSSEGVTVTEGTLADWEDVSALNTGQEDDLPCLVIPQPR